METFQLLEGSLLHWIEVLVLSGIKFAFAPALSMGLGFTYLQTIIITSIGGLAGVYFFYYLSGRILKIYNYIKSNISLSKRLNPAYIPVSTQAYRVKSKKSFTFRNKTIVKTRSTFGLRGIAVLTPVVLSIPVGAFLVNRYYGNCKKKFIYMGVSVILWSFLVSTVLFFIQQTVTV